MPSDANTRRKIIDKKLLLADNNHSQVLQEFDISVTLPEGVSEARSPYEGHQFSDYVLLGSDGKPPAVVEAPFTVLHPQGIRGLFSPSEINEIVELTQKLAV